jgi:hypothetical protein
MSVNSERLQRYLDAETAILGGQRVKFGERELTMADLAEVRSAIKELQSSVANETAGSGGGLKAAQFSTGSVGCSD